MSPLVTRFSVVALAFLCSACLGSWQVEKPPPKEPDRFVRPEVRFGAANPSGLTQFNHPLELSVREWTRILENVWVQREPEIIALASPQEPPIPAFTADEIAFLSKWLSKWFKLAHPDEWVVFGLARARSADITEVTTGGWFVEEDKLYLTLGNYRYAVTMESIREQLWNDPLQSMGSRNYIFAAGEHQSVTLVGRGPLAVVRGTRMLQLIIDYKSLLATPSVANPAQKSDAPKSAVSPEGDRFGDMAQKLRELKQLRDEGVITEEDYRMKKKQLLDKY